jgi:hypothetical protein
MGHNAFGIANDDVVLVLDELSHFGVELMRSRKVWAIPSVNVEAPPTIARPNPWPMFQIRRK